MNLLSIDYGTKRVGLAISVKGVIAPLTTIPNNDQLLPAIKQVVDDYEVSKIYIGLSTGYMAKITKIFIKKLQKTTQIPTETVEESVSTIAADQIFKQNSRKSKNYKQQIDSIAAAVILSRTQV